MPVEGLGGAGFAEDVGDAVAADADGGDVGQGLDDGAAEAAGDLVVLDGEDAAGLAGGAGQELDVDGLDGVDVDDAGADAVGGQHRRRLDGGADGAAGGDDGQILALDQGHALAELELVA